MSIGECSCSSLDLSGDLTPGQRITTASVETIAISTALKETGRESQHQRTSEREWEDTDMQRANVGD